jgi:UPF0755 protein
MKQLRWFIFFFLLLGICISVLLIVGWASSIPNRAEMLFGPPAPQLGFIQRFQLSWSIVNESEILTSQPSENPVPVLFEIDAGESTGRIIGRLQAAGLISNPQVFRDYLVYTGSDTRLQPGTYTLNTGMTPIQVSQTIQNLEATGITFRILAGWRIEEIAAALPTSGLAIAPERFLDVAWQSPRGQIAATWPESASVEGLLLPDSYALPRDLSAEALVAIFIENFIQKTSPEVQAGFQEQGLTLFEGVIIASIVEREAVVDAEQPLIASVFLNRVAAGMRLEADPTVQYALGFTEDGGWWKAPLALVDLEIDSPYNTYRYGGLPPGPIANPGLSALQAVAYPEESVYYFFRAACDGSGTHVFALTFEEHKLNACE